MGIELCNLDPCCTMHRHGVEKSLQGHQNKINKALQLSKCQSVAMTTESADRLTFVFVDCCVYICM